MLHPRPVSKARKPGCIPCRERHLKCGHETPTCLRCRRARNPQTCYYAPKTIRVFQSAYSALIGETAAVNNNPELQITPSPPSVSNIRTPAASEINEEATIFRIGQGYQYTTSPELADFANAIGMENDPEKDITNSLSSPVANHTSPISEMRRPSTQRTEVALDSDRTSYSNSAVISLSNETSDNMILEPFPGHRIERDPSTQSIANFSNPSPPTQSLLRTIISDSNDAKVFDFYIKSAGPWLDIVSPEIHFGHTVPQLALQDPMLLHVCLAYSSRILMLSGEIDETRAEEYNAKAIEILILRLASESTPARNEALLATSVIMRMAEQFSEMQDDGQHHLQGALSLFTTYDCCSCSCTLLGAASFWVYLRQNIRMCFLNEEPCQFDLTSCDDQMSSSGALDSAWTNRMTYLLARVCTACWKSSEPNITELKSLSSLLDDWKNNLPNNFEPWCQFETEFEPFPIIRYVASWHAVAWQYYFAARAMLGLYGQDPSSNLTMFEMNRYLETEILVFSRLVCAITFSSQDVGVRINGTHLVAWCGQLFTGKEEQRRIIDFLQDFMHEINWPNQTCCDRLQRIWSGVDGSWVSQPP